MNLPLPIGTALTVSLDDGPATQPLGRLARTDQGLAWQWHDAALASGDDAGANLLRRQLPFTPGVHRVGLSALGVPGIFSDSLPDAWGRLLVDRTLRKRGVDPLKLGHLDRLALVGANGPGAITFAPAADWDDDMVVDLDQLAKAAEVVLERDSTPALIEALAQAGGSAGGSRPKAWIRVDVAGNVRSGAGPVGSDESAWLVKFRARRFDPEDIASLEYAYASMAEAAGLVVPQPWLVETKGGLYFASRRYDRVAGRRVHVVSAAGLLEVQAEQAMAFDYADLIELTRRVTRSEVEVHAAYRHAVFNVLAHNRDDHLKQFGFMRHDNGAWTRTPAYDLTFSDGPYGRHTLLVAGSEDPDDAALVRLADQASIKKRPAAAIRDEVRAALADWPHFATDAGVSNKSRKRVADWLSRALS